MVGGSSPEILAEVHAATAAPPGRPSASLREAYGRALADLGKEDPSMVVVEAAPAGPTGSAPFGQAFPARYHSAGAAEKDLLTVAAELSVGGRVVFASTPSLFAAGVDYDAVRRSIALPRLNVKVVATNGGLLPGRDGAPSALLEDLALMRSLPGMTVVVPADAPETAAATRSLHATEGPAYLRLIGESSPVVTDGRFELGRFGVLREGGDLTYIANGRMVPRALEAAEEMARSGVDVRVLNASSMKPFDVHAVLRAAQETGAILALEEHTVLTGLGAAVASATADRYPVPVHRIGIPDTFGGSGGPDELLERFGLGQEHILEESFDLLKLRGRSARKEEA